MGPVIGTARWRRLRATASMLAVALALLAGAGCDYFKPADPEAPSPTSVIIPNYSQPENTLETLAKGIEDKGRTNGLSAYAGGLAEDFKAGFDAQTVNRMEQQGVVVPDEWNLSREEAFYSKFVTLSTVALNSEYSFRWIRDETQGEDVNEAELAILHKEYQVFAIRQNGETVYIANGFATLHFSKVSANRWAITRWEDRERNDADIGQGEVSMGQRRLEP